MFVHFWKARILACVNYSQCYVELTSQAEEEEGEKEVEESRLAKRAKSAVLKVVVAHGAGFAPAERNHGRATTIDEIHEYENVLPCWPL